MFTVKNTHIRGLLLDMDGVLYHGTRAIGDAIDFMQTTAALPQVFITNNPILLPEQIADKLANLGFVRPDPQNIITSGIATALWLQQQKPQYRFFAIGAEGLHSALSRYGTAADNQVDYVVIGEGPGIDYEQLSVAINLITKEGAQLISTNPDNTVDAFIDGQHRLLPGGGALVAPLVSATGQHPITIGKPAAILYEMGLQRLQLTAAECLMIGDRPDTDIHGAVEIGLKTALVRTGRFGRDDIYPDELHRPDIDCDSLSELLAVGSNPCKMRAVEKS